MENILRRLVASGERCTSASDIPMRKPSKSINKPLGLFNSRRSSCRDFSDRRLKTTDERAKPSPDPNSQRVLNSFICRPARPAV